MALALQCSSGAGEFWLGDGLFLLGFSGVVVWCCERSGPRLGCRLGIPSFCGGSRARCAAWSRAVWATSLSAQQLSTMMEPRLPRPACPCCCWQCPRPAAAHVSLQEEQFSSFPPCAGCERRTAAFPTPGLPALLPAAMEPWQPLLPKACQHPLPSVPITTPKREMVFSTVQVSVTVLYVGFFF